MVIARTQGIIYVYAIQKKGIILKLPVNDTGTYIFVDFMSQKISEVISQLIAFDYSVD